jgi:hypothetical protein
MRRALFANANQIDAIGTTTELFVARSLLPSTHNISTGNSFDETQFR